MTPDGCHHGAVRAGIWLSGIAAALAVVVGVVGAADGLPWLLVPAVASLVTVFAWVERRSVWWGALAAAVHWTPLLLLAATAWDWVWLGAPLVPAALAQTVGLVAYSRAGREPRGPAHA